MWHSVPVSNSPLTHNQCQPCRNPFENKVWEVYFSKEVCSFVIIVDYVSECICILIVVLRQYDKGIILLNPLFVTHLSGFNDHLTLVICLHTVKQISSSSSCRAASTDIPDPLPPLLPLIHRFWQVFRVTSRILT